MSMERNPKDPIIADRIARFKRIHEVSVVKTSSSSQIEFPYQPIERVAGSVLKELEGVRQAIRGSKDEQFEDNPLTAAYKNYLFIHDFIWSPNLDALLIRTHGKIFFDRNKSFYYGLLPVIPDEEEEDKDENQYLCFNDGQYTHPLKDPATFQEVWDRADSKAKSSIAKFGRLPRKQIINKFENFAKNNITFF
jgi:hypothetical protein